MKNQGFTLIEVLFALAIFGLMTALPLGILTQTRITERSENRTGAVAAAQRRLDYLRLQDPTTLPATGHEYEIVTVGSNEYAVYTDFCSNMTYCNTANNRHIKVRVHHLGTAQLLYTVETVYTQLK